MLKLSKETRKELEATVRSGQEIPAMFVNILGEMYLSPLLEIAVEVENTAFIRQLRIAIKLALKPTNPKIKAHGSRKPTNPKINVHRNPKPAKRKIHVVPLSLDERMAIANRLNNLRRKIIMRSERGRSLYAHFVQGGAPGLRQQQ